jgi:hypothetical protein
MQAVTDFIHNGSGQGSVAERLVANGMDVRTLRPFIGEDGRSYVTNAQGKAQLIGNAATLRKDEWAHFDTNVIKAARLRLKAWNDLATLSGTYGGFNGMASMVLEHETMSDPGEAFVNFDGMVEGRADAPVFQLEGLPLPITHVDFFFSSRRLAISRKLGTPIDTSMGEAAARRVAEKVEQTTIGTIVGPTLDPINRNRLGREPKVYGYTNFPDRLTKDDMTNPTDAGWDPATLLGEILDCLEALYVNKFYGPFMVYHSTDWTPYLDADYYRLESSGAVAPSKTLRQRIKELDGVTDVRRLDFLGGDDNPFTLLFVQMTPDVARAVNGLGMTTVQWETMGGMRINFKVMCIHVPQLRSDFYGNCGILEAKV